jgi:hypothetical protein
MHSFNKSLPSVDTGLKLYLLHYLVSRRKNKIMSYLKLTINRVKLVFGIHFGPMQCIVNVNCIKVFNRIRYSTIGVLDE